MKNKTRNRTLKRLSKIPGVGPADNIDELCELFMKKLRALYRGHKAEINPWQLVKLTARFEKGFCLKQGIMLDALMRRGWLEPSAADTYIIRYDLVRR